MLEMTWTNLPKKLLKNRRRACARWCGSLAETEGGSRAPRTMPADLRSGKLVCTSALLVYECAFGDWFAIARGAHDPPLPVDCARMVGFFAVC